MPTSSSSNPPRAQRAADIELASPELPKRPVAKASRTRTQSTRFAKLDDEEDNGGSNAHGASSALPEPSYCSVYIMGWLAATVGVATFAVVLLMLLPHALVKEYAMLMEGLVTAMLDGKEMIATRQVIQVSGCIRNCL